MEQFSRFEEDQLKLKDRINNYAREWFEGEYKFYKPYRTVPVEKCYKVNAENYLKGRVNKDGTGKMYTTYLRFPTPWYEQDHWAYRKEHGVWYVYRVQMKDCKEVNRKRIGSTGEQQLHKDAVLGRILDGVYKVSMEQKESHTQSWCRKTIQHKVIWAVDYDGLSMLQLLFEKPKMSAAEIEQVIVSEGGYVDKDMIIHKGTAKYTW